MAKKQKTNTVSTVRRTIWFVIRAVLLVSLLLGLAYGVFTEGMYISNMYIIVTEGMENRADNVLKNTADSDLSQFFTEDFLNSDEMLLSSPYLDWAVDSFDYRYEIKGISVLPWAKTGSVKYVERIPSIVATPISDEVTGSVPAWKSMLYRVNLVKVDGRWLISNLIVIEESPEEEARPTPDYSQIEKD